ncbi:peptide ABC transporter substrate-binding protein [Nevskia ramosa]|uniref:peptide ABC transporter substrate-binding protein n=1 Tax=Nevskia ramosa TaxID=64002 RepID=UPI003D0CC847
MLGLVLASGQAGTISTPATTTEPAAAIRIGNGPEPESLDPQKATSVSAGNVLRDLYEGLTGVSPSGELIPAAAESWTWSADGRELRLQLREGLRWSNGDPLLAEHYVAGLQHLLDPATNSGYASLFAAIEHGAEIIAGRRPSGDLGVLADNARSLRIRLDRPLASLPDLLAHPAASPLHPADRLAKPGKARIGNGAYRLVERTPQSRVVLARNPLYWNAAATTIERVEFIPTEDLNSELKRYRAGEFDITSTVPAAQAKWIREQLGGELHVATYLGSYFYGYNLTQPPFKAQPKLRLALSMAVDRELIVDKVLHGLATPALSLVPPGISNYSVQLPAWAALPRAQQLAEARRLYAEAGYSMEHPLEVEIRYNTSDDNKRLAVVIAAMWKQTLGVRVKLVNEEWKVFLQHRRSRVVTQAFRNTWIGDVDDALGFVELFGTRHPRNDSGYAEPAYDQLLKAAAEQADPQRRRAALEAAERRLLEDAPILPIYFYASKHLVKPYVEGWQDNLLDWHYTKDLRLHAH